MFPAGFVERMRQLRFWSKPAEFDNFLDVDFDQRNRWKAAEQLIARDAGLRALKRVYGLWLVLMLCLVLFEIANRELSIPLLALIWLPGSFLLPCIAFRAHRVAIDGTVSKSVGAVRLFRTWVSIAPFSFIPGWVVALVLKYLLPIRLRTIEDRFDFALLYLGCYWRYAALFVGARDAEKWPAGGLEELAQLTIERRTEVFDLAAEPGRYWLSIGGFIIACGIALLLLFPAPWIGTAPAMFFSAIGGVAFVAGNVYGAWRYNPIGAAWLPMLLMEHIRNPAPEEALASVPVVAPVPVISGTKRGALPRWVFIVAVTLGVAAAAGKIYQVLKAPSSAAVIGQQLAR